jgi:hypothetical protein
VIAQKSVLQGLENGFLGGGQGVENDFLDPVQAHEDGIVGVVRGVIMSVWQMSEEGSSRSMLLCLALCASHNCRSPEICQQSMLPQRRRRSWLEPPRLSSSASVKTSTLGPLNIRALELFLGCASPCLMDLLAPKI